MERVSPEVVRKAMPDDYVDKQPPVSANAQAKPGGRPATTRAFIPLATQPTKLVEKLAKLGGVRVSWKSAERGQPVWQYVVYAKKGDTWTMNVVPGNMFEAVLRDNADEKSPPTTLVAVSAVDRLGVEGPREIVQVGGKQER